MMMNPLASPAMMSPMYSQTFPWNTTPVPYTQNQIPTPWPLQYQNMANVNSNMLPYNMMPQQQPDNNFYYS